MKNKSLTTSILLLTIILMLVYACAAVYNDYVTQSDTLHDDNFEINHSLNDTNCLISNQQGWRQTTYNQCACSQNYIYFSYTKDSCVDAYNYQGEYQFTILLPDYPNGGVGVCCFDDKLYIQEKNGDVRVFDKQSEVEFMTRIEAKEKGFGSNWFREQDKAKRMQVTKESIYIFDASNAIDTQIPTPQIVAEYIPNTAVPIPIILISLLLLVCLGIRIMIRKHRESIIASRRL